VPRLLNFSEAASLGLHTMTVLAKNGQQRLTNREIAGLLGASAHHLAKVMQRLAKVGLVDSIRGPQGGFVLGKPAKNITLLDIFEAIEGPVEKAGCLFRNSVCDGGSCVLGRAVESAHEQLREYLGNSTLDELAADVEFTGQIGVRKADS
jgi:Rrf2 family protein